MATIFYQGEDITLNLELLEEDNKTLVSFAGKEVSILAYTDRERKKVILSTKDRTLNVDEYLITGTIKPKDSRELGTGVLIVEILIESGLSSHIVIAQNITIEPSIIGFLNQ